MTAPLSFWFLWDVSEPTLLLAKILDPDSFHNLSCLDQVGNEGVVNNWNYNSCPKILV